WWRSWRPRPWRRMRPKTRRRRRSRRETRGPLCHVHMDIKRGIAVSPGVAIGPALVLDTEWFRLPQRYPDPNPREQEGARLRQALPAAAREARENQETVSLKLGPQYGAIFGAHALMLTDPSLQREIEALVRGEHYTSEYAVSRVIRRYAKALESI